MNYKLTFLFLFFFQTILAQEVFTSSPIPDDVFLRMQGHSYGKGCTIPREELRYLRITHCNKWGKAQQGEIICNKSIASQLLKIFRELYHAGYRIESVRLIDDFDGDDERSMAANNTSCFNFRTVQGSKTLSKHSRGLAIDINPLYNPHVTSTRVSPAAAKAYAYNRSKGYSPAAGWTNAYITRQDLAYKLFTQYGFRWGGAWKHSKDYQHFER